MPVDELGPAIRPTFGTRFDAFFLAPAGPTWEPRTGATRKADRAMSGLAGHFAVPGTGFLIPDAAVAIMMLDGFKSR